jgi:hypothetical protein
LVSWLDHAFLHGEVERQVLAVFDDDIVAPERTALESDRRRGHHIGSGTEIVGPIAPLIVRQDHHRHLGLEILHPHERGAERRAIRAGDRSRDGSSEGGVAGGSQQQHGQAGFDERLHGFPP